MRRWIAAIGFLLLPGNALALSCMPPTPESVFNLHSDGPERYLMAFGTLTPAGPLPEFNPQTLQHEPSNRFDATFEGHLAGTGGFDRHVTLPVTVRMKCFDDICDFLPGSCPRSPVH